MNVPLVEIGEIEDKLIWGRSQDGQFSVKTAYGYIEDS